MKTLGNILWIILGGGLFLFFFYLLAGIILCFTIIGIPFGIQCIKLSLLSLLPFGKEVAPIKTPTGALSIIMNIIWIIMLGLEITIMHLIFGVLLAITIIGLPFAKQHLKLASLSIMPFGHNTQPAV